MERLDWSLLKPFQPIGVDNSNTSELPEFCHVA